MGFFMFDMCDSYIKDERENKIFKFYNFHLVNFHVDTKHVVLELGKSHIELEPKSNEVFLTSKHIHSIFTFIFIYCFHENRM
jgi:hypothetical protein